MFQGKKILISMLIVLFGFTLSCDNDEKDTETEITNSAAKISITDFQNIETTYIPMTEMYFKINEVDDFYDNEPSTTEDSTDTCVDDLFSENSIKFEKDTEDTYKLLINDIDFKKCISISADIPITINRAVTGMVMEKIKFYR